MTRLSAAVALALIVTIHSCVLIVCGRLELSTVGTSWASQTTATNPREVKVHQGRPCPLMLFEILVIILVALGVFVHALVSLIRALMRRIVHILVIVIHLGHVALIILTGTHVIHGRILPKHALS